MSSFRAFLAAECPDALSRVGKSSIASTSTAAVTDVLANYISIDDEHTDEKGVYCFNPQRVYESYTACEAKVIDRMKYITSLQDAAASSSSSSSTSSTAAASSSEVKETSSG